MRCHHACNLNSAFAAHRKQSSAVQSSSSSSSWLLSRERKRDRNHSETFSQAKSRKLQRATIHNRGSTARFVLHRPRKKKKKTDQMRKKKKIQKREAGKADPDSLLCCKRGIRCGVRLTRYASHLFACRQPYIICLFDPSERRPVQKPFVSADPLIQRHQRLAMAEPTSSFVFP